MLKDILTVLVLTASGMSQITGMGPTEQAPAIPAYSIKLVADPNLTVPYSDKLVVVPGQCDADGNPYVAILGANGLGVVGLIGNRTVMFSRDKMTDIPEPDISRFFVAESAVYVLVTGLENAKEEHVNIFDETKGKEVTWKRKTGETHEYVARFDRDGTYRGAVRLDFPLRVLQLAAFSSGTYLVAGVDNDKVPRVGLLNASGQLQKYVELEKDLGNTQKSAGKAFAKTFGSGETGSDVIAMFASFYAYGDKVLLVRVSTGTPIYEIRDGGEARAITIKPPAGYTLWGLIPSDKTWVADFAKPSAMGGLPDAEGHVFYEVNPETGELVRELRLERDAKVQPACWGENKLTAIRHADDRITVLRGTPEAATAKSKPQ